MKSSLLYRTFAVVFAIIGLVSLMNTITGYAIHQEFLWKSALFALMDFCVAWGFYQRHQWLTSLLGLNALGQIILYTLQCLDAGEVVLSFFPLLGLILALALFAFVYSTRRMLRNTRWSNVVAIGFFIPWALSFGYTVAKWIS